THISASTVFEVLARFKASSLSWPLPADISHDTLEKLIFPPKDSKHPVKAHCAITGVMAGRIQSAGWR
ncbi:hypothetical protein, partial [Escherichia coli]|uniref:hypothetical protein n=1 Tax=Escherichia coli TaxID=562 RepID=UPI0011406A94